ncbi:PPE domain-containing protein [Nocardia sp. NPDC024068]|uniref:PPE domain-containing protein n=1 Tax=Nocardia sp. NPDC024068 TaxID=3157197 RepID=UPI0033C7DDE1
MIEPPQPGFTGVVWPARPADRLARELTTGPGGVPMAEAVAAWARVAASLGAAVVEYEKAVAEVRGAWGSGRSNEVLQRISTLRDWLIEATGAAAANMARFQAQVAAYEVARLAMPAITDIQQIQQIQEMLESIGGSMGAVIKAVAADADKDSDMAKAVASRVMENYEKATEPLALAWQQTHPPMIAPETALAAENSAAVATEPPKPAAAPVGGMGPMPGGLSLPGTAARTLTAYTAPAFGKTAAVQEVVPNATSSGNVGAGSRAPIAPGMMGGHGGGGGGQEGSRFPRASLPGEDEQFAGAGEIQAAPAVLGGVEAAQTAPGVRTGGTPVGDRG